MVGNLPARVTSFVGRRREIGQVREFLAASRLVTLTGSGGVGKTRLAVEAAADLSRAFTDGVWLVDLASVTDATLVAQAVANGLGLREHSSRPVIDPLVDFLTARQLLIVLDNCEHLLDGCAALVDQLLRCCPRLRILATSREALGVEGECVSTVGSLTAPDPADPVSVDALGQYEAVRLLVDRAAAARVGFAVTEHNRDAVARLCASLDGLPLAIELAATRLRSLSVEQVLERLTDRFRLLTGGSRAALPRQRTLRALIDWSYDLCTAKEQRLWARLSVFTGGFDLEAAEEVCAGGGVLRAEILYLVDRLIARSIVTRVGDDRPPRFQMLKTLQEYGEVRLIVFGEQERVRQEHRDYFRRLARHSTDTWCGPDQEVTLARLRADHGNLRSALESSLAVTDDIQFGLEVCAALRWHWCADGFLNEGRIWLERLLAVPAQASSARAHALWVGGWIALLQGDSAVAMQRWDECRQMGDELGDPMVAAHAMSLAGSINAFRGQATEAVAAFEAAVSALTEAGDTGLVLMTMFQLAAEYLTVGERDRATETAREAIRISEACGEHWARSYALWVSARCDWLGGDVDEAWRLATAGLELQRAFRDSVGAGLMIEQLAWIAATKRDFLRAAGLLGTAHSVWSSIGADISAFGPANSAFHADCERETILALRESGFRAAFEQGMRPSVEQAIETALEGTPAATSSPPRPLLTRREREVAELIGQGLSNRQAAERLVLSQRTVDGHVEHVLAKLGFTSRAQVAAWVARER
jgi:predicted ATPase/DNA-binding CsgD family transcriptional regulator